MSWERARTDEQKEVRIREILETTLNLYKSIDYDKITFALIAKENNSARSNIYKYFETKEEIFMEYLSREIASWSASVCEDYNSGKMNEIKNSLEFARYWFDKFMTYRTMVEILNLLYTTLEKNVSLEALRKIKRSLFKVISDLRGVLIHTGVFQGSQAVQDFLEATLSFNMGFFPLLSMTEKQKEAMLLENLPIDESRVENLYIRTLSSFIDSYSQT